ncbi:MULTISPECIES: hypothetical protein [Haloferax]|nr:MULTISPECIES: hypothetical protein [Haloferax]
MTPVDFVRASKLYHVESQTAVRHPALDATDADVRRAVGGDTA